MASGTWDYRSATRVAAVAAIMALTGCGSLNPVHWYHDVVGGGSANSNPPADSKALDAGSEEPYPSLASVPSPATTVISEADQKAMADGLIADRANARYAAREAQAADVAPLPPELATASEPTVAPQFAPQTEAPPPLPSHHRHRARAGLRQAPPPRSAVDKALAASGLASGGAFGSSLGGSSDEGSAAADTTQQVTPREEPKPEATAPVPAAPALAPTPTSVSKPKTPSVPTAPEVGLPSAPVLAPVSAPKPVAGAAPAVNATPSMSTAVRFAPGTTALPAGASAVLAPIAKAAQASGGKLRVISHASGGGDAAASLAGYQDALARANAVKQALVASGVPAADIVAEVSPTAAATGGDKVDIVAGQ